MKMIILLLVASVASANLDLTRISSHTKDQFSQFFPDRLNEIAPSIDYNSRADREIYYYHKKYYNLDFAFEDVWDAYISTHPAKIWKGKIIDFDFLYDKDHDSLFYSDSNSWGGLAEHQVIFFNLTFLRIYTLAGAFEITEVSNRGDWALIEFTYIEGNTSRGRQKIFFKRVNDKTVIEHISFFKSGKKFRDKFLYPYFHEKAIDELHANVLTQLKR